nr:MAG TPA: hypothetical protein [Caudoviricetes sp.]
MALNFNGVEPTQIIAKNGGSEQTIAFPTGTKTVTVFQQTIDGKKQARATFTSTHNITASMVTCNDKMLNSSSQLISEQTQASTTYLFYAKFSNNTLSLEQVVVSSVTGEPPQSVVLQGRDYSAIFDSATDLTVLKYNTTAVWGKPFSLTIQAGANSTVTVNRTSSPNQHASTGNITSGGIVYYGDTLTITATPASGYKLIKFTINGTEYANSETSAVSQTVTVTSAVSIVINTEAAISWKTVWTGSETVSAINATTGSFSDGSGMYSGSRTIQHEIVSNAYPTRITFTLAQESPQITDITQSVVKYLTIGSNSSVRASINSSSNNIDFITVIKGNKPNSKVFYLGKIVTLTKVEQYY